MSAYTDKDTTQRLGTAAWPVERAVLFCALICIMTALMGCDWPRAVHPTFEAPGCQPWTLMARSIVQGFPVPASLLATWMLRHIPSSTSLLRRWRGVIILTVLIVGLIPLWNTNRWWCYRLGTPGFMTPFALSVIFFAPAWNMAVASAQRIKYNIWLTVGSALWVAVWYFWGLFTGGPMWPMVLPVPLVLYSFYNAEVSGFLRLYMRLMCGCTAVALAVRIILYLLKINHIFPDGILLNP